MTLSDFSIRNPVAAWMIMVALILFGAIGFSRMGVSELPDVDFPVVSVHLSLEGAAPEVIETDVVDVVEDALTSVQGIREISSTSQQGSATVSVEFELGKDIDDAVQEIQTKLLQAQRRLPNDIDPPTVTKINSEDNPIMWLALSGNRPVRDLMEYTRDHLKDRFQTISGVGEIILGGFLDPNLRVWLDAKKLIQYEITTGDVIAAIEREHVEFPAGRIETAKNEFNIRMRGEAATPEEFGNIVIQERGGAPIHRPLFLKDVAIIEPGLSDVRRLSRVMGETAVGLGIRKQRGSNSVAVAHAVRARLAEIQPNLPADLHLGVNFDSTRFIEESVHELNFSLVLSAILTGIVCWLFLGSLSASINTWLAIPTSIIGAFLIMFFGGFTLNNFTLLALILAIGIVVDDAIMVLENIVRHQEMGQNRMQAASNGARQITFAATAATFAVIAIFLPVAFMKGVIGTFFFQFGVTLSVAVLLSLLEALTLTPMRASQFVTVKKRKNWLTQKSEKMFHNLSTRYENILHTLLSHRWKVLLASLLFFVLSLTTTTWLRKEFVPSQDQSMFMVNMQTPVGSSIEFTDERFKQAEALLLKRPEVTRYFAAVGGFGGGEVNSGIIFITLKPPRERNVSQQEVMDWARKSFNAIPDLKAFVVDFSNRGFGAQRGTPIEFTVRGHDWGDLVEASEAMRKRMEKDPIFTDVNTGYQADTPEIQIIPDRIKAAAHGVSVTTIAETVNLGFGGMRAGRYPEGSRKIDVRVMLQKSDRQKANDVQDLFVRNNRGELIPLTEVTRLEEKPALLTISRKDRERAITITSNVAVGRSQADAIKKVETWGKELPEGYHLVLTGAAKTFQESFGNLGFALWLGVIIAYMILAAQYNSYIHPFTVLLALPFSISGAFLALLITQNSLNLYSMIGLLLLMGIVKKNSILLVDFTNQVRKDGKNVREALLHACPIRLRPILMTSAATIAAAIPPALGIGPGAETRIPMAVVIIGGVLVSTVLTLFVVPCAYSLLAQLERKPHRTP